MTKNRTGSVTLVLRTELHIRALHGPGGPARPVLYNFEKPSGRAGPGREITGPGRAGLVSIMTSLISDSINRAV